MADATHTENRLLDMLPIDDRVDLVSKMDRVAITPEGMVGVHAFLEVGY